MTLMIENTGGQVVELDNPEQVPGLIVFDSSMNQVGTWTRFLKALPMHPPDGPIVLETGQTYSWTFEWGLGVYSTTGAVHFEQLVVGDYNVQASIIVNISESIANLTSNVIQIAVT